MLFLKKCIRVTLFYQLHEQEQKQHPMKYEKKKNESFYGIYMQQLNYSPDMLLFR